MEERWGSRRGGFLAFSPNASNFGRGDVVATNAKIFAFSFSFALASVESWRHIKNRGDAAVINPNPRQGHGWEWETDSWDRPRPSPSAAVAMCDVRFAICNAHDATTFPTEPKGHSLASIKWVLFSRRR